MKIIVFGASGATGHQLVHEALSRNHTVTAFVRNRSKLKVNDNRLTVVEGDVKNYSDVENSILGHDAVLSALGVSKPLKKDPNVVEGVRNIIHAMKNAGIKRIIYLSFIGVGEGRNHAGFLIKHIISRIVHNEIEDHLEKESIIAETDLDWTIIHPPKLSNGKKKGSYRVGENIKSSSFLATLSRADLADFMIKQLGEPTFIRKKVRIL